MTNAVGRVVEASAGLPYRVVFPDVEHEPASLFLRDLAASDCRPTTLRSCAYDLLRWLRFLHDRHTDWRRGERVDVRALVEHLRAQPTANALRRNVSPQSINGVTYKRRRVRWLHRTAFRSSPRRLQVVGMRQRANR